MPRQPSAVTRLARGLTAVITVWCLGCSALEPILDSVLGASIGMACASEGGSQMGVGDATEERVTGFTDAQSAVAVPSHEDERGVVSSPEQGPGRFACGCQSCIAPSPLAAAVSLRSALLSEPVASLPALLLGIDREPLVPPPQRDL